jgi:hypothetical protein
MHFVRLSEVEASRLQINKPDRFLKPVGFVIRKPQRGDILYKIKPSECKELQRSKIFEL